MAIRGTDNLFKKLKSLDKAIQGNITKKAVAKGCQTVRGAAVMLCPVKDGDLRESIMTKVEEKDGKVTGTVYTNKEYAPYVEFGTGPKGQEDHDGISPNVTPSYREKGWSYIDEETDKRVYTRGQAAQPFMYPALKDNEDKVIKEIAENIADEIKKLVK